MKKSGIQVVKRMDEKTVSRQVKNHLQQHYSFSPAMAEVLMKDTRTFGVMLNPEKPEDDQIRYQAVSYEEPAGKALKECKMIPVVLSVYDKKGIEIKEKQGLYPYRKFMIEKLCAEAQLQGAVLTHEDLAALLHIERKTISRQIAKLRQEGKIINTRASYTDSGRGVSHKTLIIKMYLFGMTETTIAMRSNHHLKNVESYIRDFLRVSLLHQDGSDVGLIGRLTDMTPKLVREYIQLYDSVSKNVELKENLASKIRFYQSELVPVKKKGRSNI